MRSELGWREKGQTRRDKELEAKRRTQKETKTDQWRSEIEKGWEGEKRPGLDGRGPKWGEKGGERAERSEGVQALWGFFLPALPRRGPGALPVSCHSKS